MVGVVLALSVKAIVAGALGALAWSETIGSLPRGVRFVVRGALLVPALTLVGLYAYLAREGLIVPLQYLPLALVPTGGALARKAMMFHQRTAQETERRH